MDHTKEHDHDEKLDTQRLIQGMQSSKDFETTINSTRALLHAVSIMLLIRRIARLARVLGRTLRRTASPWTGYLHYHSYWGKFVFEHQFGV
jgi:hypothetical protein